MLVVKATTGSLELYIAEYIIQKVSIDSLYFNEDFVFNFMGLTFKFSYNSIYVRSISNRFICKKMDFNITNILNLLSTFNDKDLLKLNDMLSFNNYYYREVK